MHRSLFVGKAGIYAFGERTPGRAAIKRGDRLCFYASGKGVVAHATVASSPERKLRPEVRHSDKYPWTFQLRDSKLYLEEYHCPRQAERSELDAFANRDPARPWAWLVQATRRLTKHGFDLLTRESAKTATPMIHAELRGKLPEHNPDQREDILTSNVFSFFQYADRQVFLYELLKSWHLDVTAEEAREAEFHYWPQLADGTEPDLVIVVGQYYLLIEAKYRSGFRSGDPYIQGPAHKRKERRNR